MNGEIQTKQHTLNFPIKQAGWLSNQRTATKDSWYSKSHVPKCRKGTIYGRNCTKFKRLTVKTHWGPTDKETAVFPVRWWQRSGLRHNGRPLGASSGGQPGCRICRRLQISSQVSYPIAGRGLSCLGSPAALGKAVSNVLPSTFSRQFRHKKTPCASTAQGVFS